MRNRQRPLGVNCADIALGRSPARSGAAAIAGVDVSVGIGTLIRDDVALVFILVTRIRTFTIGQ